MKVNVCEMDTTTGRHESVDINKTLLPLVFCALKSSFILVRKTSHV